MFVDRKLCHTLSRFFFFSWNETKKKINKNHDVAFSGNNHDMGLLRTPSSGKAHRRSCWARRELEARQGHHIPRKEQCCWDRVQSPPSGSCSGWNRPRACWVALVPAWEWQCLVAPRASWPAHRPKSSPRSVGTVGLSELLVLEEMVPWWRQSCSASVEAAHTEVS